MSKKVALQVENLSLKNRSNSYILEDISFTIKSGQFIVLAGCNGSGKSMLLRTLKGLTKHHGGKIIIEGEDLSLKSEKRNREIGLVFQDADTQIVGQTVERDLLFGLENLAIPLEQRRAKVEKTASLLQISDLLLRSPRTLSGGERRKVAIGGVLVMEPHLIMLDEPFANLDYPGVVQVLRSLLALKESGKTIIVATHEIEKILAYSDSVILLNKGRVAFQESPALALTHVEKYGVRRPMFRGVSLEVEELTWLN